MLTYYKSDRGRFLTADPYRASGGVGDPGSWNRYAYTRGDPVGRIDASGLFDTGPFFDCLNLTHGDVEWCTGQNPSGVGGIGSDPCGDGNMSTPQCGSQVQQGGGPSPATVDNAGRRRASNGLAAIASGRFAEKASCRSFLQQLVGANGSIDGLIGDIRSAADRARGHVYDGLTSKVALTEAEFGSSSASGQSTVGEWFAYLPGRIALSQQNGDAIFLRNLSDWDGYLSPFTSGDTANSYGMGVLMHELLHKKFVGGGFDHDQMGAALLNIGINPNTQGREKIADGITHACF